MGRHLSIQSSFDCWHLWTQVSAAERIPIPAGPFTIMHITRATVAHSFFIQVWSTKALLSPIARSVFKRGKLFFVSSFLSCVGRPREFSPTRQKKPVSICFQCHCLFFNSASWKRIQKRHFGVNLATNTTRVSFYVRFHSCTMSGCDVVWKFVIILSSVVALLAVILTAYGLHLTLGKKSFVPILVVFIQIYMQA